MSEKLKKRKVQSRKKKVKEKLLTKRNTLVKIRQADKVQKRFARELEKLQNRVQKLENNRDDL